MKRNIASLQAATLEITSEKQAKAYLHPLRMKILGFITKQPMTITQVAQELKVHPANITHHFKILEKSKLIQLVEERDIGRNIEKYYQASAQHFEINPPQGVSNANAIVLNFLKNNLNAAIANLRGDDEEKLIGLIMGARINPEQFIDFCKKMQELIKEFSQLDSSAGVGYTLNLSLYPYLDQGPLKRIEIQKKQASFKKKRD